MTNPFVLSGYAGPEYLCDRERETGKLEEAALNNRNITLYSPLGYGKTGLIYHLFEQLKKKKVQVIYLDILPTNDLNQFIEVFSSAILQATETKTDQWLKRAGQMIKSVRPKISLDEFTGMPHLQLNLQSEADQKQTLAEVFAFLAKQEDKLIIAIDEFQQITEYPEENVDGLLRKYIQPLQNATFLFSGSQKHLLLPLFSDVNRPFYQSTDFLALAKLAFDTYKEFIAKMFRKGGRSIGDDELNYILWFTKRHTYYTQFLCNRLYSKHTEVIEMEDIRKVIQEIFEERETIFHGYRKLLSKHQFQLLRAIAQEDKLISPTSQDFLKRYDLSNAATVSKSLQALLNKEVIYEEYEGETPVYQVYDVFLSRWLQNK